jgi:galactokinase
MRVKAYAPGRVELLGNHTDYNQGVVLGVAIDRGLNMTGENREEDLITINSTSMGRVEVRCAELRAQTKQPWVNYVLGVVRELNSLGIPIAGFSADLEGNLPVGCGLSSSAALEVATALLLLKLHQRELPPLEIAKACQRAERAFVGVQSGLFDQVTSIFGRADHTILFDARTEEVRTISFPRGLALIVTESGRKRQLRNGLYNDRVKETRAAADALGVHALRDVSGEKLKKATLPLLLSRRAAHIVEENERVWRAVHLFAQGDGVGFGALMNESHESSRSNFDNSSPELDMLVEIAQGMPGVLGARLTGAGWGGATITLCEEKRANAVAEELAREYAARTKLQSQTFVCKIGDGAHSWLMSKK